MKTINFDNSFAAVLILSVVVALSATEETAQADSFGSGANTFNIDFVTIGNPGNVADTTGRPNPAGSVPYTFRMGQFEISEQMVNKANAFGGLGITNSTRGPNKPATVYIWFAVAKFVNWLNTSTGGVPAYKFDNGGNFQLWTPSDAGYNPANLYRNSLAKYVLPSTDEWYKAAYYDPNANGGAGGYWNYATGSDSVPTAVASGTSAGTEVYNQEFPADITLAGGLSPLGTMAQGGNAWEWEESNGSTDTRDFRGGVWPNDAGSLPSSVAPYMFLQSMDSDVDIGFRVASVSNIPEPSTLLLGALASVGLLLRRKHLKKHPKPTVTKKK